MKIFISKDEPGLHFKIEKSRHSRHFQLSVNRLKPSLSIWWVGYGGYGGKAELSQLRAWTFFITEVIVSAVKDGVEIVR